jgi:hypothetical protein
MVYKRSLPPPSVRAIRQNQATRFKRNMETDAGKSPYVRGRGDGLVAVPKGPKAPSVPNRGRNMDPGMRRNRIDPIARSKAARERAILTNQNIVSSRNIVADAGKSTYVRGKNNGLVAVPNVMVRRRPAEMDPGFGPRTPRPAPGRGSRGEGKKAPRYSHSPTRSKVQ